MLSFKKVYKDELLQLALILSLLRSHSDSLYDHDVIDLPIEHFDLENGTSWRSLTSNAFRNQHVHPKNFDTVLLNYEREMFADINALGRYNRFSEETIRRPNITAYLLNVNRTSSPISNEHSQEPLRGGVLVQPPAEPPPGLEAVDVLQRLDPLIGENPVFHRDINENALDSGIELTQEDMDLIEVLWKQDVDLGFSLDIQQQLPKTSTVTLSASGTGASVSAKCCEDPIVGGCGSKSPDSCASISSGYTSPKKGFSDDEEERDYIEKLNALKEINSDKIKVEPGPQDSDPWAGLDYTIDTETGEYVIKGELDVSLADAAGNPSCDALDDLSLPLPEFLLEDALQLVGIDDDISQDVSKESVADEEQPGSPASTASGDSGDSGAAAAAAARLAPEPGSIASALLDAANAAAADADGADPHAADRPAALALDADDDDLRLFDTMIQTSQFHHPHHSRAFQGRMPFVRTVSIEQHWQDLANLLSMPPGHHPSQSQHQQQPQPPQQAQHGGGNDAYHHHYQYGGAGGAYHLQAPPPPPAPPSMHHPHHAHHMGMAAMGGNMAGMGATPYCPADNTRNVLLHNATLNPPIGELNGTGPGPSMAAYGNLGGTNIGNAVATSMNLTNSSEPMGDSGPGAHYKLEPTHDLLYYQNTTSELNQTDGLLSSILNDEDLQLMDMAMNEGMYTMRMLDNANTTASGSLLNQAAQHLSISNGAGNGSPSAASAASSAPSTASGGGASSQGQGTQSHRGGTELDRLDRLDTSSDSAVSSMGSERVPSLSDGEWGDAGSDSGHTAGDHYVTDYHRKFGPYDYSYSSRQHTGSMTGAETRIPPVAQKKHQMYGKRYFQEQGNTLPSTTPAAAPTPPIPIKYEYRDPCIGTTSSSYHPQQHMAEAAAKVLDMKYYGHGAVAAAAAAAAVPLGHHHGPLGLDHVQHNHTYHLPVVSSSGAMQRPISRDKGAEKAAKLRRAEEEHLTRDEKRARALNVPISVDDIINLPMDEFNERLSKYDLSESQLSLIRDIRRRGKNKVAAQNCRKRKLDQILTLADEVKEMRDRKIRLINDHDFVTSESIRIKEKYQQLYRHVFQNLRDPDGNHYSPYQYSLQTSADGSILVVPLSTSNSNLTERKEQQPPQKD